MNAIAPSNFHRFDLTSPAVLTAKAPGVVSGLSVQTGPQASQDGLVISPGTAIDPYGREAASARPDWWRLIAGIRR